MRPELVPLDLHYKTYAVGEVILLTRNPRMEGFIEVDPSETRAISENTQNFVSDDKKFIVDNTAPYFHLILMWLYPLIKELEEASEPVTVLFRKKSSSQHLVQNHLGSITDYIAERLISMGHKVEFLNENTEFFYINNLNLYAHPVDSNINSASVIAKFLSKNLDYSKKPFEKIYLSRAKTPNRSDSTKLFNIQDNSRIDDPKAIENYFKLLGFKIVFPEDLESFEEQLQLIASAKILASVTSAALATSIVMPPGGAIVELSYPLGSIVSKDGTVTHEAVFHNHYKDIATVSKSSYMAIPHQGTALDLINFIESNVALKGFLSS